MKFQCLKSFTIDLYICKLHWIPADLQRLAESDRDWHRRKCELNGGGGGGGGWRPPQSSSLGLGKVINHSPAKGMLCMYNRVVYPFTDFFLSFFIINFL